MNPVFALVQAQKFCARDLQSVILIYVGAMQVNVVAVLIVPCVRGFDRKNIGYGAMSGTTLCRI